MQSGDQLDGPATRTLDRPSILSVNHFLNLMCFKKPRCDDEQGAVCKLARERRQLRDQAGCGLERSSPHMSVLAFGSASGGFHFLCGLKTVYTNP